MVATQQPEEAVAAAAKPAKQVVQPAQSPAKGERDKKRRGSSHGQPLVIGLSHKTATVEVREKLSIPEANWNLASKTLTRFESVQEAAAQGDARAAVRAGGGPERRRRALRLAGLGALEGIRSVRKCVTLYSGS